METIKSSAEISYLFAHGRRFSSPYLTLIIKRTQHDQPGRVAFIAGKKSGNAVWRNKAKRRLRSLCKDCGGSWEGIDIIFLAKPQINDVTYSKVLTACNNLLKEVFLKCV